MGMFDFFNFSKKSNSKTNFQWVNDYLTECYTKLSPYEAYNSNAATSISVDTIAEKVSDIHPVVKVSDGEVINNHLAIEILKNGNPYQTFSDIMIALSSEHLLFKNSYVKLIGNIDQKPLGIFVLKNNWVTLVPKSDAILYKVNSQMPFMFLSGSYTLNLKNGRIIKSNEEDKFGEIIHFMGYTYSNNNLVATNRTCSINEELQLLENSMTNNVKSLSNGLASKGILNVDTNDMDAYEEVKNQIKNNFSGQNNGGKTIITRSNEIQYTPVQQTNNRDMQLMDLKNDSAKTVFQRYEMPLPLVDGSAQTYNNYLTAQYALYDNAILPLYNKIMEGFTKSFRNRGILEKNESLTFDPSTIPALRLRLNEELKTLSEVGVNTINELRAIAGFDEIEDGGDVYIKVSDVPLSEQSDISNDPPKGFVDSLKLNGASEKEIKDYWNS